MFGKQGSYIIKSEYVIIMIVVVVKFILLSYYRKNNYTSGETNRNGDLQ